MNVLNSNSELCARMRRHLDEYLSRELLGETAGAVESHLAGCPACSEELGTRTRVRDTLRGAAASQAPPEELREKIQRQLREMPPGLWSRSFPPAWAMALAGAAAVVLLGLGAEQWIRVRQVRQTVHNILALGVSDHIICAIKGHNYPEAASTPAELRRKLGPQYAGLLDVVQQKLPGFEVLEAHLCSLPGSPRKYVHFITRGQGTILSVILTKREGEHLPAGRAFGASAGVGLYEAHLEGMNAAGFESKEYFGFVVSDLNPEVTVELATQLAPTLKAALDVSS